MFFIHFGYKNRYEHPTNLVRWVLFMRKFAPFLNTFCTYIYDAKRLADYVRKEEKECSLKKLSGFCL